MALLVDELLREAGARFPEREAYVHGADRITYEAGTTTPLPFPGSEGLRAPVEDLLADGEKELSATERAAISDAVVGPSSGR